MSTIPVPAMDLYDTEWALNRERTKFRRYILGVCERLLYDFSGMLM